MPSATEVSEASCSGLSAPSHRSEEEEVWNFLEATRLRFKLIFGCRWERVKKEEAEEEKEESHRVCIG